MFTTTGNTEEAEDGDNDGDYDNTGKTWRKSGTTPAYRVTSRSREPDMAVKSRCEKLYPRVA